MLDRSFSASNCDPRLTRLFADIPVQSLSTELPSIAFVKNARIVSSDSAPVYASYLRGSLLEKSSPIPKADFAPEDSLDQINFFAQYSIPFDLRG